MKQIPPVYGGAGAALSGDFPLGNTVPVPERCLAEPDTVPPLFTNTLQWRPLGRCDPHRPDRILQLAGFCPVQPVSANLQPRLSTDPVFAAMPVLPPALRCTNLLGI